MKLYIGSFVVMCILSIVLAQQYGQFVEGPCTRFNVGDQIPFSRKLLMGPWFVYATYDYPDVAGLDCLVAYYRLTPDGNALNTETGTNLMTNTPRTFQSTLNFDRPGVGHYTYNAGALTQGINIPLTDYSHFYIEFGCIDGVDGGLADAYFGIFTRKRHPSLITVALINAYLNAHGVDRTKLRYVAHDIRFAAFDFVSKYQLYEASYPHENSLKNYLIFKYYLKIFKENFKL